jgi:YggT family protein
MSIFLQIIIWVIRIYEFLILIRVILSWVGPNLYHPAIRILYQITEPVLGPLRRLIPPIGGTIDLSPVVALFLLELLSRLLTGLLVRL